MPSRAIARVSLAAEEPDRHVARTSRIAERIDDEPAVELIEHDDHGVRYDRERGGTDPALEPELSPSPPPSRLDDHSPRARLPELVPAEIDGRPVVDRPAALRSSGTAAGNGRGPAPLVVKLDVILEAGAAGVRSRDCDSREALPHGGQRDRVEPARARMANVKYASGPAEARLRRPRQRAHDLVPQLRGRPSGDEGRRAVQDVERRAAAGVTRLRAVATLEREDEERHVSEAGRSERRERCAPSASADGHDGSRA